MGALANLAEDGPETWPSEVVLRHLRLCVRACPQQRLHLLVKCSHLRNVLLCSRVEGTLVRDLAPLLDTLSHGTGLTTFNHQLLRLLLLLLLLTHVKHCLVLIDEGLLAEESALHPEVHRVLLPKHVLNLRLIVAAIIDNKGCDHVAPHTQDLESELAYRFDLRKSQLVLGDDEAEVNEITQGDTDARFVQTSHIYQRSPY